MSFNERKAKSLSISLLTLDHWPGGQSKISQLRSSQTGSDVVTSMSVRFDHTCCVYTIQLDQKVLVEQSVCSVKLSFSMFCTTLDVLRENSSWMLFAYIFTKMCIFLKTIATRKYLTLCEKYCSAIYLIFIAGQTNIWIIIILRIKNI